MAAGIMVSMSRVAWRSPAANGLNAIFTAHDSPVAIVLRQVLDTMEKSSSWSVAPPTAARNRRGTEGDGFAGGGDHDVLLDGGVDGHVAEVEVGCGGARGQGVGGGRPGHRGGEEPRGPQHGCDGSTTHREPPGPAASLGVGSR